MPEDAISIGIITGSVSRMAGGMFHSVRRRALALSEAGHSVLILGGSDAYSVQDWGAWQPLAPIVAPRMGPATLGYAPLIGRVLRDARFNLVHQSGIWTASSAQIAAWRRRTGGPLMISPHGMLDPWALRHSGWKKRLAGLLYENANLAAADCLHALSRSEAAAMRAYGLSNPIAIIPNGIDLPGEWDRGPAKCPSWMPTDARRTLLFLGRIHPKKGIRELIEAWTILKANAPLLAAEWCVLIAGWDDGGHLAGLQQLVARNQLEGDVRFAGPLHGEAKDAALRNSDAFVLPSYSEGLPMSVLEAWTYRLPVFMTEACNLPEGFSAGAAIRIDVDPTRLAERLAESLGITYLADLGVAGRRLVETQFRWPEIMWRYLQVYRWMLDGGELPDCIELGSQ